MLEQMIDEARETLRESFETLNAEQINRMMNEVEMSITENNEGQPQLVTVIGRGGIRHTLNLTFPPAQLQSSPETAVSADDERVRRDGCGEEMYELTDTEVRPGERRLPPFDPSIERVAPARYPEVPAGAMASGDFSKVEITRESVSVEEVIAKIEALEKEIDAE